jgi:hypothetical protein
MSRTWERVVLVLFVCVPIPALAFSGLSVPLPSVVERIAAALVPFGHEVTVEDGQALAAGEIVLIADRTRATASPRTRTVPRTVAPTTRAAGSTAPRAVSKPKAAPLAVRTPVVKRSGGTTLEEHAPADEPRAHAPREQAPQATPVDDQPKQEKTRVELVPTTSPDETKDTEVVDTAPVADLVSEIPLPEPVDETLDELTKPIDLVDPKRDLDGFRG